MKKMCSQVEEIRLPRKGCVAILFDGSKGKNLGGWVDVGLRVCGSPLNASLFH